MTPIGSDTDSRSIGQRQQRHQREEFRTAVRALLMTPLMNPAHEDFAAVRRQAEPLRDWFARETGWMLQVEREGARLFKRPADLADAMRGLPGYDRRRYVLLCLACAVLERADPQITLRLLGERLLQLAAEPALAALGFSFTLGTQHERRELVAVCRTLLELGVLQRVAGDEEAFVQRRRRSGRCALRRAAPRARRHAGGRARPSTWTRGRSARRRSTSGCTPWSTSMWRTATKAGARRCATSSRAGCSTIRWSISRAWMPEARAYFVNQRGAMAARLCEAAGLVAEQRAEGLALVDETGSLTDVAMPAEGTDAHATLLVAEYPGRPSAAQRQANAPTKRGIRRGAAASRTSSTSCARPRTATAATGASRRANPAPNASWPPSRSSGWKSCSLSCGAPDDGAARCRRSPASRSARPKSAKPETGAGAAAAPSLVPDAT